MRNVKNTALLVLPVMLSVYSTQLFAYVGPGSGLSAIGSILALIAAFFLAVVGFIWYPIKRLIKGKKSTSSPAPSSEPQEMNNADADNKTNQQP